MILFNSFLRQIFFVISVALALTSHSVVFGDTLNIQINSSSDDAEEFSSGEVYISSSDLELADSPDSASQTIGLRFNGVNLPAGATINNAYLQFQVDETSSGTASLNIYGEANPNPVTYIIAANNISSRPKTTASVSWTPANWNNIGAKGIKQRSPNLASIIQELISQAGWNSGQSMAFIISGSGTRTAESFDGSQTGAPTLYIEYSSDGNPAPIASFTATPSIGSAPLEVTFDGTASSDNSAIASYSWNFGDGSSATGVTSSHTYTPGTYTATLTVTDDAGKTNSISHDITAIDPNATTVLNIQVSNSNDDAEEYSDGTMYLSSSDLELTQDGSSQTIGMRFNGIAIPSNAVISSAYLQFQVDESSTGATQLSIHGENNVNPASFNTNDNNITSRSLTNASASWNPVAWPNVNQRGVAQRSTDLSNIVQEIIGLSGWNSGQSMVFIINGSGKRVAESFDGSPAGAATLHIEYSMDGNPAPIASFTATPGTGNAPLDVSFDATSSSDNSAIVSYSWDFGDGSSSSGVTTSHTYTPGTYTVTLTVTDDAGKTNSTSQTITAIDPNITTHTLDVSIVSPTDDAEQFSDGTMYLDSSDLELVTDFGGAQQVGIRFKQVKVPRGSVITKAYLQFQTDETSSVATSLVIRGETSANPLTFTTAANNISSRPLSNASVNWNPVAWNIVNERGVKQQSPDLSSIVQELIDQNSWNKDQSMAFILTGSGKRIAESYEGSVQGSATLHIEYTHDGSVTGNAPWKELNVTFNGIGMGVDKLGSRLFFPLGAGYAPAANLTVSVDYLNAPGYKIGINGSAPLNRGASYNFGAVTYGSDATIEIYKNNIVTSSYSLVLTSTPVIEIEAAQIVDEPKLPGLFRFLSFETGKDTGELNMGIETRGGTSQWYAKKPYAIEFTKYLYPSKTKKVKFMDMRKDDDWIMDPAYRDLSFVRNIVAADIARDVQPYAYKDSAGVEHGENSIHGYLTEVIQNGQYQGIYLIEERIDRKQLDLKKITVPVDGNGNDDWSQVDFNNPENGSVLYKGASNTATFSRPDLTDVMFDYEQKYPKEKDIVRYEPLQSLIDFIVNSSDQEFIDGIGDRVDIDSVVDFWLMTVATQSTDTLKKNYYIAKSGSGKFKLFIWDFDAAFGMQWHGGRDDRRHAWNDLLHGNVLLSRLLALPQTGFNNKLKARWSELRASAFSKQSMYQHFVKYDAILQPAGTTDTPKSRNLARWPDSGAQEDGIGAVELGELPYISDFLDERLQWLDGKISNLPQEVID